MVVFISGWSLFCICSAILLLAALAMQFYSGFFVTKDVLVRDFTMLDLELASSEVEIDNTLNGIAKLEPAVSERVAWAVKNHLYADFVFMPAAYGSVFIACMKVAWKMPESGAIFFSLLGWLQIAAWISDMLKNIYLLRKIGRFREVHQRAYLPFHTFQLLEAIKWGLSMLAAVSVLSALLYFWISGRYMETSLTYLLVMVMEGVMFAFVMRLLKKPGKSWRTEVH